MQTSSQPEFLFRIYIFGDIENNRLKLLKIGRGITNLIDLKIKKKKISDLLFYFQLISPKTDDEGTGEEKTKLVAQKSTESDV